MKGEQGRHNRLCSYAQAAGLRQKGVEDVMENFRTFDVSLEDNARELTEEEFALVSGGWGLSLGDGFNWGDYRNAVLGGLVRGAAVGGISGAVSGAAQGSLNYIIHHPPTLK